MVEGGMRSKELCCLSGTETLTSIVSLSYKSQPFTGVGRGWGGHGSG